MEGELTERQRKVLEVLIANPGISAGRVWALAFGDVEPYRGRRDAGMTATLDAMQRLGWVRGDYLHREALGRDWTATPEGTAAYREASG